jgi:hypothetical protein
VAAHPSDVVSRDMERTKPKVIDAEFEVVSAPAPKEPLLGLITLISGWGLLGIGLLMNVAHQLERRIMDLEGRMIGAGADQPSAHEPEAGVPSPGSRHQILELTAPGLCFRLQGHSFFRSPLASLSLEPLPVWLVAHRPRHKLRVLCFKAKLDRLEDDGDADSRAATHGRSHRRQKYFGGGKFTLRHHRDDTHVGEEWPLR